jgi:hypothetical protein
MTEKDHSLAEFQAALLNALDSHVNAAEIFQALRKNKAAEPFEEWIDQMNPAMIEIGAELVKKWGRK